MLDLIDIPRKGLINKGSFFFASPTASLMRGVDNMTNTEVLRELHKLKIYERIEAIHDIMDYVDDGYHNDEYHMLVQISNRLVKDLTSLMKEEKGA